MADKKVLDSDPAIAKKQYSRYGLVAVDISLRYELRHDTSTAPPQVSDPIKLPPRKTDALEKATFFI